MRLRGCVLACARRVRAAPQPPVPRPTAARQSVVPRPNRRKRSFCAKYEFFIYRNCGSFWQQLRSLLPLRTVWIYHWVTRQNTPPSPAAKVLIVIASSPDPSAGGRALKFDAAAEHMWRLSVDSGRNRSVFFTAFPKKPFMGWPALILRNGHGLHPPRVLHHRTQQQVLKTLERILSEWIFAKTPLCSPPPQPWGASIRCTTTRAWSSTTMSTPGTWPARRWRSAPHRKILAWTH